MRTRPTWFVLAIPAVILFGAAASPADHHRSDASRPASSGSSVMPSSGFDLPRACYVPNRSSRAPLTHTVRYYMVAMSDSVHLNTDVATPSDEAGPWPVMLYRTPYGIQSNNIDEMADQGYVAVSQDTRGRFGSEGVDRMFRDEGYGPDHRDGLETVQWILRQPWCNGRVCGSGVSASAINENLLAAALPESARCTLVYFAGADFYNDLVFPGGAFKQIDVTTWLRDQGAEWNLDSIYAHPDHDDFWKWLDTTGRLSQETIPTYQVGGWFDIFPDGPIHSYTGLQFGGGPGAAGNQKLIMGPWTHCTDGGQQGQLDFPNASSSYAAAIVGSPNDFLNYWVMGVQNGVMKRSPVAYYLMGDVDDPTAPGDVWKVTSVWPPPSVPTNLYLTSSGGLSLTPPASEAPQTYTFNPHHPVPTLGGGNLVIAAGPYDQRPVLSRPDVLVYETPVLTEPWEVTGEISVELYISSDCLDTDFTAKLCDVYPDGRAMLMTDGILRARHRISMDEEDLLVPGQIVPVTIRLPETAIAFNTGHRILLAVSSSNLPRFDVNPNNGKPFMQDTTTVIAHNTVYHQQAYPSRMVLPLTGHLPSAVDGGTVVLVPPAVRLIAEPNPFVARTAFRFALSERRRVDLCVMDPAGRLVRALAGGWYASGLHEVLWDGTDGGGRRMPSGVYRVLLHDGAAETVGSVIRVK